LYLFLNEVKMITPLIVYVTVLLTKKFEHRQLKLLHLIGESIPATKLSCRNFQLSLVGLFLKIVRVILRSIIQFLIFNF